MATVLLATGFVAGVLFGPMVVSVVVARFVPWTGWLAVVLFVGCVPLAAGIWGVIDEPDPGSEPIVRFSGTLVLAVGVALYWAITGLASGLAMRVSRRDPAD